MNDKLVFLNLRLKFYLFIIIVLFFVLFIRLFFLQVVYGEYYVDRSENNRIRIDNLPAPRGNIFDRNNILLAGNRPAYNLEVIPEARDQSEEILEFVSGLLELDIEKLKENYQILNKHRKSYQTAILVQDLSRNQIARVAARRYHFPELEIKAIPVRDYIHSKITAHSIGYIREINSEQLSRKEFERYLPGDLIGQDGIEQSYESHLQGFRGKQAFMVNAQGQKIQETAYEEPISGSDLHITIDHSVQEAAYNALGENSGAVLAVDPRSGEILAMVSKPSYDPNIFNRKLSVKDWNRLVNDPEKIMNNRVLKGQYPPGSMFKIIMSLAGLSESLIDHHHHTKCLGTYHLTPSVRFKCHKLSGHGSMNLVTALERSCNVYYYTLGQELGIDRIHKYASLYGFGKKTNLELKGEVSGLVPSREWKKKYFKKREDQKWYLGETPSVSIGQGALLASPLQIARTMSAIVNGGKVFDLTLVKNSSTVRGRLASEIDLNPEHIKLVKQGLHAVVNAERGTGKKAALPEEYNIEVAGKTATAQVKSTKFLEGKDSENHAWFVGFAPYEEPEIVVVALVEHGGHGGVSAAPVVGEVLRAFFSQKIGSKKFGPQLAEVGEADES